MPVVIDATAERVDADTVKVTYQGTQKRDIGRVTSLNASVSCPYLNDSISYTKSLNLSVGSTATFDCPNVSATDKIHVEVIATQIDGSKQGILIKDL